MGYKVIEIVDGDTFKVSPDWEWVMKDGKKETGDTVRIADLNAPEKDSPAGPKATRALSDLINGKEVELKNKVALSYGRLVCDVYLDGRKIVG